MIQNYRIGSITIFLAFLVLVGCQSKLIKRDTPKPGLDLSKLDQHWAGKIRFESPKKTHTGRFKYTEHGQESYSLEVKDYFGLIHAAIGWASKEENRFVLLLPLQDKAYVGSYQELLTFSHPTVPVVFKHFQMLIKGQLSNEHKPWVCENKNSLTNGSCYIRSKISLVKAKWEEPQVEKGSIFIQKDKETQIELTMSSVYSEPMKFWPKRPDIPKSYKLIYLKKNN